jgi:hypothetical protein
MLTATENTNTVRKVSFTEVHKSIMDSAEQLSKLEFNENEFIKKGNFLEKIGFKNSLATYSYKEYSDAKPFIDLYSTRYVNNKFILSLQIQRVCEDYDLYERPLEDYVSDIPIKNINDIENFKVHINDIDEKFLHISANYSKTLLRNFCIFKHILNTRSKDFQNPNKTKSNFSEYALKELGVKYLEGSYYHSQEIFDEIFLIISKDLSIQERNDKLEYINQGYLKLEDLPKLGWLNAPLLKICATKNMFSFESMQDSSRFLNYERNKESIKRDEQSKFQVETDPIVLFKVNGGYLIVTAWGDEANHDFVVNNKLN